MKLTCGICAHRSEPMQNDPSDPKEMGKRFSCFRGPPKIIVLTRYEVAKDADGKIVNSFPVEQYSRSQYATVMENWRACGEFKLEEKR